MLQVGGATWQFLHNMPTLKAADLAYMFAMSDNIFYSVLLAPGSALLSRDQSKRGVGKNMVFLNNFCPDHPAE